MKKTLDRSVFAAGIFTALFAITSHLAAQDPRSVGMKLGQDQDPGASVDADGTFSGGMKLYDVGKNGGGGGEDQAKNTQVNNPLLDSVQIFNGFRPFVRTTQSEVSAVASGKNVVVTYNNSAGLHVSPNATNTGLVTDQVRISGYSTSNDGGKTWTSGYIPAPAGGGATDGDPSIATDRKGNFYFANLAQSSAGFGVFVNKSTDGGKTWTAGVTVGIDGAGDKEWLAVGPDPVKKSQDNVYVTWTSFRANCELRFGRSTDGGATFASKTIFIATANANQAAPQNCLQFSNIVVDSKRGTIYVPFLRFSNADQDFIQMLISDDAGVTFRLATFNVPGAPTTTVYPVTQPGELTSCGTNNLRLTIHGPLSSGVGQFGLPRYVNASRLVLQPSAAARDGVVYLAWPNSTSLFYGDPAGHSNILFMRSDDGGNTWRAPVIANPIISSDPQHVAPSLAIDGDNGVHISYYTQHANGTVDLNIANSSNGGATFPVNRNIRVTTTSFTLPPTNLPLTGAPNYAATNFDRQIAVCYGLGEYQSLTTTDEKLNAAWGDARNLITEPVNALDPISGQTHSQADVFFASVESDD